MSERPTEPVACTLDRGGLEARGRELRELFAAGLVGQTRTETSLVLRFRPGLAAEVGALAEAERACWPFLAIAEREAGAGTELSLTAPPGAGATLDVFALAADETLAGA